MARLEAYRPAPPSILGRIQGFLTGWENERTRLIRRGSAANAVPRTQIPVAGARDTVRLASTATPSGYPAYVLNGSSTEMVSQRAKGLVYVLRRSVQLLAAGRTERRNEVWYSAQNDDSSLWEDRDECFRSVDDAARLFGVPRCRLGITCYPRAVAVGPLYLRRIGGAGAPATPWRSAIDFSLPVDDGFFLGGYEWAADAVAVVVVEKECALDQIEDLCRAKRWILVSGGGYPTCAAHMLVHMLSTKFSLDVYVLTDFGPDGAAIVLQYMLGSYASAHETSHFTAPVKWLGLRASQAQAANIPARYWKALTDRDRSTCESLLATDFVRSRPAWATEIRTLLDRGSKCELEDIYHILPRPGSPVTTCAAQTLVDFIEHEMRNALG